MRCQNIRMRSFTVFALVLVCVLPLLTVVECVDSHSSNQGSMQPTASPSSRLKEKLARAASIPITSPTSFISSASTSLSRSVAHPVHDHSDAEKSLIDSALSSGEYHAVVHTAEGVKLLTREQSMAMDFEYESAMKRGDTPSLALIENHLQLYPPTDSASIAHAHQQQSESDQHAYSQYMLIEQEGDVVSEERAERNAAFSSQLKAALLRKGGLTWDKNPNILLSADGVHNLLDNTATPKNMPPFASQLMEKVGQITPHDRAQAANDLIKARPFFTELQEALHPTAAARAAASSLVETANKGKAAATEWLEGLTVADACSTVQCGANQHCAGGKCVCNYRWGGEACQYRLHPPITNWGSYGNWQNFYGNPDGRTEDYCRIYGKWPVKYTVSCALAASEWDLEDHDPSNSTFVVASMQWSQSRGWYATYALDRCATERKGCSGHGRCPSISNPTCICEPGYAGANCEIEVCPPLVAPVNGKLDSAEPTVAGKSVKVSCDYGYVFPDGFTERYIKCLGANTWKRALPQCQKRECPGLFLPHGSVSASGSGNDIPPPGTDVIITNKYTRKVLNLDGGSRKEGGVINTFTPHGGATQRWNIMVENDGSYYIKNKLSGTVLTLLDNAQSATQADEARTNGVLSDNQLWKITSLGDGSFVLLSKRTGLPLKPSRHGDGALVVAGTEKDGEILAWTLPFSSPAQVSDRRTFSCDVGYNLVGSAFADCAHDGQWSYQFNWQRPTCVPAACPRLNTDAYPNLMADRVTGFFGAVASFACADNQVLTGASSATCSVVDKVRGRLDWVYANGPRPVCEPKKCGPIAAPDNGQINVAPGANFVGKSVVFSCNEGFALVGPTTMTCAATDAGADWQYNGMTASNPLCVAGCRAFGPTNGGSYVSGVTSAIIGNTVTLNCKAGFSSRVRLTSGQMKTVQTFTATCLEDKTYDINLDGPPCEPSPCPALVTEAIASVTAGVTGTISTFTCKSGFERTGSSFATCTATGGVESAWVLENPAQAARCVPIRCPNLISPEHGSVDYTEGTSEQIRNFACDAGFVVVGTKQVQCVGAVKNWVDLELAKKGEFTVFKAPVCLPACPSLTGPDDGSVELSSETPYAGSSATIKCNPGFYLKGGNSKMSCLKNGKWDKDITKYTCKQSDCMDLVVPKNVIADSTVGVAGVTRYFSCAPGFVFAGSASATCESKGWVYEIANTMPSCKGTPCSQILAPDHSTVDGKPSKFITGITATTVNIDCAPGYSVLGHNCGSQGCQLTCDGKNWSPAQMPTCVANSCPSTLSAPKFGLVDNGGVGVTGQKLGFRCHTGYKLRGAVSATCSGTSWVYSPEGTTPLCVPIATEAGLIVSRNVLVDGRDVKPDVNGTYTYFGGRVGTTVFFSCATGFQLRAASAKSATVAADGAWQYDASAEPACDPAPCKTGLPVPANGAVDGITGNREVSGETGQTRTFTCLPGFGLRQGASTKAKCLRDGSWKYDVPGQLPVCDTLSCPELVIPKGLIVNTRRGPTNAKGRAGKILRFACEDGYDINGPNRLECMATAMWDKNVPTCTPRSCIAPVAAPKFGFVEANGYGVTGQLRKFSCALGYTLSGAQSATCNPDGNWAYQANQPPPKCNPTECPVVRLGVGVMVNGDNKIRNLAGATGDVFELSCAKGYDLDGPAQFICQADRTWNSDAPTCVARPAKKEYVIPPRVTVNGAAAGSGVFSVAGVTDGVYVLACEPGYALRDRTSDSVTVNAEGEWVYNVPGVAPICDPLPCPGLKAPANGALDKNAGKTGDAVAITCNDGYRLDGVPALNCLATSKWDNPMPTCVPLSCPPLTYLFNGRSTAHGGVTGTTVTFSCNEGYVLEGATTTFCDVNTKWTNDVPKCNPKPCPALVAPANGKVDNANGNTGDVRRFACADGYTLHGTTLTRCKADGKWYNDHVEAPTCAPNSVLKPLTAPENGFATGTTGTTGTKQSFSCRKGFTLHGSRYAVVGTNGDWAYEKPGDAPRCEPQYCDDLTNPKNGRVSALRGYVGQSVEYTCDADYSIIGSAVSECGANLAWTHSAPLCQALITVSGLKIENVVTGQSIKFTVKNPIAANHAKAPKLAIRASAGSLDKSYVDLSSTEPQTITFTAPAVAQPVTFTFGFTVPTGKWAAPQSVSVAVVGSKRVGGMSLFDGVLVNGAYANGVGDGNDYFSNGQYPYGFIAASAEECAAVCDKFPECVQLAYTNGNCNLQRKLYDGSSKDPAYVSAIKAVPCQQIVAPSGATVDKTNVVAGQSVTFTCNAGYAMSGSSVLTCQNTGKFDLPFPTCSLRQCLPSLQNPTNGNTDTTRGTFGTIATFTCAPGFELSSAAQLKCEATGKWSSPAPKCVPKACSSDLEAPADGMVDNTKGSTGTIRWFSCKEGRKLVGDNFAECRADGTWSQKGPVCAAVCSKFKAPAFGTLDLTEDGVAGQVAHFSCNEGYTLVGQESITCGDDGQWNSPAPFCRPNPCAPRTAPKFGKVDKPSPVVHEIATYSCLPGYSLDGLEQLTCLPNGKYNGEAPTCVPNPCPEITRPAHGQADRTVGRTGDKVTYTCDAGYRMLGRAKAKCKNNGDWSQAAPLCQPIGCATAKAPKNGFVSNKGEGTVGDTIQFSCGPGFRLIGNDVLACLNNNQWSSPAPSCRPLTCPRITLTPRLIASRTLAYTDQVAEFDCEPGFTLIGSKTLRCLSDSKWNGVAPTCVPGGCEPVPLPANVLVDRAHGLTGEVSTFNCAAGYTLVGAEKLTCMANGRWSGEPPTCAPKPCPDISAPKFGFVDKTIGSTGSVRTFSCLPGYILIGNEAINCRADGTWSGGIPACRPGGCPNLSPPVNGELDSPYGIAGDVRTFSCFPGYSVVGSAQLTCLPNRQWSAKAPVCEPNSCTERLTDPAYGTVSAPTTTTGKKVYFACKNGFALNGPQELLCQPDGAWNGMAPTCEPNSCMPPMAPPVDGSVTNDGLASAGTSVRFDCKPGFNLVGSNTAVCLNTGKWSGEAPQCEAIPCPDLTNPPNGKWDKLVGRTGSVRTLTCEQGFRVKGRSSLKCRSDSSWDGRPGMCKAGGCDSLTAPEHGSVNDGGAETDSVATVTCDTGYTLEGSRQITCQRDGQWSHAVGVCAPRACADLRPRPNSIVEKVTGVTGTKRTFTCEKGYHLEGEATLECRADGSWSHAEPVCAGDPCKTSLPTPENGMVDRNSGRVGEVATFSCAPGYTLKGLSALSCQADLTWSGVAPTCEANPCSPSLTAPVNGTVSASSGVTGSRATFACTEGFEIKGAHEVECQTNGKWSADVPTCEPKPCPLILAPINGIVDVPTGAFGAVRNFNCITGYNIVGALKTTCTSKGTWSKPAPICKPLKCSKRLKAPVKGSVDRTLGRVGDTAEFTCNAGYTLEGANTIKCLSSMDWSGPEPTCRPNPCRRTLVKPDHGSVDIVNGTTGQIATFACDAGFTLLGSEKLKCRSNGQWSDSEPTCMVRNCVPSLSAPLNGDVSAPDAVVGEERTFTCDEGYQLVGSATVKCQENGLWSAPQPTCRVKRCGPAVKHPFHGKVDNLKVKPGSVHKYTCDVGFSLVGVESITCKPDGAWSDPFPVCVPNTCAQTLTDPLHGTVSANTARTLDIVNFTCNAGYKLNGASSIVCQPDGKFNKLAPTCVDDCLDVKCVHGICQRGTCRCDEGFTGQLCELPSSEWKWTTTAWDECSRSCGGTGTQTRKVSCANAKGLQGNFTRCGDAMPASEQPCNTQPCLGYNWQTDKWEGCSAACGSGQQFRTVSCLASDGTIAEDNKCPGARPVSSQSCNTVECAWNASPFSSCSASCGGGKKTRFVTCGAQGIVASDAACSAGPKPATIEDCNTQTCIAPRWVIGEFNNCTKPCNGGTQTRNVMCEELGTGAPQDEKMCVAMVGEKPISTRACNTDRCVAVHWQPSVWSDCSVSCGGGFQTRTLSCRTEDGHEAPLSRCVSDATNPKPNTKQPCNSSPCVAYYWAVGEFGACSTLCGGGTQDRKISCMMSPAPVVPGSSADVVDDSYCVKYAGKRADTTQSCNSQPCLNAAWEVGTFESAESRFVGDLITRSVDCVSKSNGQAVSEKACLVNAPKPSATKTLVAVGTTPSADVEITAGPVAYAWSTSEFSACSASCGGGQQSRTVECVGANGKKAVDAVCALASSKPAAIQSCNTIPCTKYSWSAGPWDVCSVSCGAGTQSRVVQCLSEDGYIAKDALCTTSKPASTQPCPNNKPCSPNSGYWTVGEFGACSVECGGGTATRPVTCIGSASDPDCFTKAGPQPASAMTCNTAACPTFSWQADAWSACSAKCGNGVKTRSVVCVNDKGKFAAESQCTASAGLKPASSAVCNSEACPAYAWRVAEWSDCSSKCGGGSKTRSVQCFGSDNKMVDDSVCTTLAPKPAVSAKCNMQKCLKFKWELSSWSVCSKSCGGGTQTRTATCMRNDGFEAIDPASCTDAKPTLTQSCSSQPCVFYYYKVSEWGQCSQTCNGGQQTRSVTCVGSDDGSMKSHDYCKSLGAKPASTQQCNTRPCGSFKFQAGKWEDCSKSCGGGVQTREITCLNQNGERADASDCKSLGSMFPESSRSCNTQRCVAPRWDSLANGETTTDGFLKCTQTCGGGVQKRNVECRTFGGDGNKLLADSSCAFFPEKPSDSQRCGTNPCVRYEYQKSIWGQCSKSCGGGTQTRKLTCVADNGVAAPMSECASLRTPRTERMCNTQECSGFKWETTPFPVCPVTCGGSVQYRNVTCVDFTGVRVDDALCPAISRPNSRHTCNSQACVLYSWMMTPWSTCTKKCGGGTHSRKVICLGSDATIGDNSKCSAKEIPLSDADCNTAPCLTYKWVAGDWQKCSKKCGGGVAVRSVTCQSTDGAVWPEGTCMEQVGKMIPTELSCNTQPCKALEWVVSPFTPCSATCGGGFRSRNVTCVAGGDSEVADDKCYAKLPGVVKPADKEQCATQPCETSRWLTGVWGSCSAKCNGGRRIRAVTCVDKDGKTVSDDDCLQSEGSKPVSAQSCNTGDCLDYNFVRTPWSACSKRCDGGVRTRGVECTDVTGKVADAENCFTARGSRAAPPSSEACNSQACTTYDWVPGAWSECTASCDGGVQTRAVTCVSSDKQLVVDRLCQEKGKSKVLPSTSRACNTDPCANYHWTTTAWGSCNAACGGGTATRKVVCKDAKDEVAPDGKCMTQSGKRPKRRTQCNTQACDGNVWQRRQTVEEQALAAQVADLRATLESIHHHAGQQAQSLENASRLRQLQREVDRLSSNQRKLEDVSDERSSHLTDLEAGVDEVKSAMSPTSDDLPDQFEDGTKPYQLPNASAPVHVHHHHHIDEDADIPADNDDMVEVRHIHYSS